MVGWLSMALSQKKYARGRLYILGLMNKQQVEALDVRYFIESDGDITPTRQGFRVRTQHFPALLRCLKEAPEMIGERVLWQGKLRSLTVRYCDDEYGKGVDFRYRAHNEKYTGWERRGLRLTLADFFKLRDGLIALGFPMQKAPPMPDLISNRHIISNRSQKPSFSGEKKLDKNQRSDYINSVLLTFLDREDMG